MARLQAREPFKRLADLLKMNIEEVAMIRYIYTFFVAVFLAMFIGIGIAVFYPEPKAPESPQFFEKELTTEEQSAMTAFSVQQKAYEAKLWVYNRNVSLIVMACAVVILAISLLFTAQLGILADGLLLGGIFTLLYGIGRGMVTDNNRYRFLVAAIGLAITLALGYVKFTRHQLKQEKGA